MRAKRPFVNRRYPVKVWVHRDQCIEPLEGMTLTEIGRLFREIFERAEAHDEEYFKQFDWVWFKQPEGDKDYDLI